MVASQFYRDKYDYREQWTKFTRRLGPLLSEGDIARAVLEAATEAAGAARGVLYLVDPHDGQYHLAGAVEADRAPVALSPRHPWSDGSRAPWAPALVGAAQTQAQVGDGRSLSTQFAEGSAAVALRWRDSITGVLLIGPERTGAEYRAEDLEFLSTVADQAAGAVVSAQLSERLGPGPRVRGLPPPHVLRDPRSQELDFGAVAAELERPRAFRGSGISARRPPHAVANGGTDAKSPRAALGGAGGSELRVQPVDLAALALEATRPVDGAGESISSRSSRRSLRCRAIRTPCSRSCRISWPMRSRR